MKRKIEEDEDDVEISMKNELICLILIEISLMTDVGRGSPLDRCVHERRTGDTKATITEHHNRSIMVI